MAEKIWKAAALMVAAHIRTHHHDFQRGLLLIPRGQDDTVIVWVFGNDQEPDETTLDHEVERIRNRLQEKSLEELGFGRSADHHTWVLVLRTDTSSHHTKAGKAFQLEMLKNWLDDVIQQAWNDTHTADEEAGVGLST